MEVPQYQSRGVGPESSGLAPANPAIVGGGAVTQGLSAAASGILVLANYELQQQQAEDVAQAGLIVGDLSRRLLAKEQELADRRVADPSINPRDLNREFSLAANQMKQEVENDPSLAARPRLKKFVFPHVETSVNNHLSHYQEKSNKDWMPWYHTKGVSAVESLVQSAARTGSLPEQDTLLLRAHETINGMVLLHAVTPAEGDAMWAKSKSDVATLRAGSAIEVDPVGYMAATRQGTVDRWLTEHGVNPVSVTAADRAAFTSKATSAMTFNHVQSEQTRTDFERRKAATSEKTEREMVAKLLAHHDDVNEPPLSYAEVQTAVQNGTLGVSSGERIMGLLVAQTQRETEHSDQATLRDLTLRVALPFGEPNRLSNPGEIYDAVKKWKLTVGDMRTLLGDMDTGKTAVGLRLLQERDKFLEGLKSSITGTMLGKLDHDGDIRFYEFGRMVRDELDKAVRENRDPFDLLDPNSKNYLGRQLPLFKRDLKEQTLAVRSNLQPSDRSTVPPPPSKAQHTMRQTHADGTKETIDEFLERTKPPAPAKPKKPKNFVELP